MPAGARASRPHPPLTARAEWHSRGRLPHWEAGETPQSITFRLADSLPRAVIERELDGAPASLGVRTSLGARTSRPRAGRRPALRSALPPALRRARFEALLDAGFGERLLAEPRLAAIVEGALLHFDGSRYRLHGWCVMPNHVHVLVTPLNDFSLSAILHAWKSFTAKAINAALGRRGKLWFEEYFDRRIRDAVHLAAALAYIENNPVKAGLCAATADWPFSSAARGAAAKRAGRPRSGTKGLVVDDPT
jgi:REP element-mobilizing transposase RayT